MDAAEFELSSNQSFANRGNNFRFNGLEGDNAVLIINGVTHRFRYTLEYAGYMVSLIFHPRTKRPKLNLCVA